MALHSSRGDFTMNDNDNNQTVRRIMPQSGLDFNMMLTDTMWGSPQISVQLKEKVRQRDERMKLLQQLKRGELPPESEKAAAWELLSFYTRDFRLSNLGSMDFVECQHKSDLAGDCLREGYMEAFATSLLRVISILELSQSKGGFLRKRQNTLTTEQMQGEIEPKKKQLLFAGKSSQRS